LVSVAAAMWWTLISCLEARFYRLLPGAGTVIGRETDVMNQPRKWKIYLAVSVLIVVGVVGSLTYYIVSGPAINHLAKVDPSLALKSIPFYYNSTYNFSSGTSEWLAALQIGLDNHSGQGAASLYLFKIGEGSGKDFAILGLDYQSNVTGGYFQVNTWKAYFQSNMTVIGISYRLGEPATYNLDFGLRVQVYSNLLFLPVAQERLRVPISFVIRYA
jgi:hypothetical protein